MLTTAAFLLWITGSPDTALSYADRAVDRGPRARSVLARLCPVPLRVSSLLALRAPADARAGGRHPGGGRRPRLPDLARPRGMHARCGDGAAGRSGRRPRGLRRRHGALSRDAVTRPSSGRSCAWSTRRALPTRGERGRPPTSWKKCWRSRETPRRPCRSTSCRATSHSGPAMRTALGCRTRRHATWRARCRRGWWSSRPRRGWCACTTCSASRSRRRAAGRVRDLHRRLRHGRSAGGQRIAGGPPLIS